MRIYLLALLFASSSCLYMREPAEIISSSSGLYKLKIALNKNKADKAKYDCVLLTLYNKDFKEITKLQTGVSNNMKWAADWYPNKDTIIVISTDIGTFAYHLTDTKLLDTITITNDINSVAETILQKKYTSR